MEGVSQNKVLYLEDDLEIRNLTSKVFEKFAGEGNVHSFSNPQGLNEYLSELHSPSGNYLIISDGNLDENKANAESQNFNMVRSIIDIHADKFKNAGSNFLLCFAGASPNNFFNGDFREIKPGQDFVPKNHKLNSTQDEDIVITPKPYSYHTFKKIFESLDEMAKVPV